MGSDEFSLPILDALLEHGSGLRVPVSLAGVVTRPDRPLGRGKKLTPSPVKQRALYAGLPVLEPDRLRDRERLAEVMKLKPELLVVASYGQILPESLVNAPRHKSLNLHPSLLPRWRGASPVSGAILHGDRVTGTTLMLMVQRMDAGPVLAQEETPVDPRETRGELETRLAHMSADLLMREVPSWLEGRLEPSLQDEEYATYTSRITKRDGLINWNEAADLIARQVRAFQPWPAAYTEWEGRLVRILRAHARQGIGTPGAVLRLEDGHILIGTGEGLLAVETLQVAGGRPTDAASFVPGHGRIIGTELGT